MLKFNKWLLNYVNDREYKRKMGKWAEEIEKEKIHDAGHEEGFAAGRKQGAVQNSLDIAKRMLAIKMPIETISKVTNLSIEQINNIN